MKLLLQLIVIITLTISCSQKETPPPEEKTGVEIQAIGTLNFGGITVNDFKDASLRITNFGPNSINLDNINIDGPFRIVSYSSSCQTRELLANSFCIISIRFQPESIGSFQSSFTIQNASASLSGEGLENGVLLVEQEVWDLGIVEAGSINDLRVNVENLGDASIIAPKLTLPGFVSRRQTTCGSFIAGKDSCFYNLRAIPTQAGSFDLSIILDSELGGVRTINIKGIVEPSQPAGVIPFDTFPTFMRADGEEFTITTGRIIDTFGNTVKDNTPVNLGITNDTLSSNGINQYFTNNGVISFDIRTITRKGNGAIQLTSGEASGFISFPVLSGAPFGNLQLSSTPDQIPANGQAQLILRTDLIYDQYGNIVEDGTEISFSIDGSASISSDINNPQFLTTQTVNGQASVIVKAGTVAEDSTLNIFANPITDQNGLVVGYAATGSAVIDFVPGVASGEIPVVSALTAIYSDRNPPSDVIIPGTTVVTVGPIKDSFGNVVLENTPVELSIDKGLYLSGSELLTETTIFTNDEGQAFFSISGNGERGFIKVNVQSGFATGETEIRSYRRSSIFFQNGENNPISMYFKHDNAKDFPDLLSSSWAPIQNIDALEFRDENFYGFSKENDIPKFFQGSTDRLPYYTWDCFFTGSTFLYGNFCLEFGKEYTPFFKYNQNHVITQDSLIGTGGNNLVPNEGQFNFNINGWNNRGAQYSSNYGGSIYVDNSSIPSTLDGAGQDGLVENVIREQLRLYYMQLGGSFGLDPSQPRENAAESDWIPINNNDKYIITAEAVARSGLNSPGVIAVIEGNSNFNDPLYQEPAPKVLLGNIRILNAQQRVVYDPPDGVSAVKLYLTTIGTGEGSFIYWDNISFSTFTSDSVHDTQVTQGVQVAFAEKEDRLIMSGGSNISYDSSFEQLDFYQTENFTMLSNILNPAVGINKTELSGFNFGSKPSSLSFAQSVSDGTNIYIFGGFDVLSRQADNSLKKFNAELLRWENINVNPDPLLISEQDPDAGKPEKRYQHGMVYVDELNTIFMSSGLVSTDGEVWYAKRDLWSIDLNQEPLTWKMHCDPCSDLPELSNPYVDLVDQMTRIDNLGGNESLSLSLVSDFSTEMKQVKMVWNQSTQKIYYYIPEENQIRQINPYSVEISELSEGDGFKVLGNAFQIMYNKNIGRTYAYERGSIGSLDSKLYYWDMDADQKQYLRTSIFLGDDRAKEFAQELSFNIFGRGSTFTDRGLDSKSTTGIEAYVYNFTNNTWVFLGENNTNDPETSFSDPITALINNVNVRSFVSEEGYVELLLMPKGRPGFDGGEVLVGNDLDFIDLNSPNGIKSVAGTNNSTCSLNLDNEIKCWGSNNSFQLGINDSNSDLALGDNPNEMGSNLVSVDIASPSTMFNNNWSIKKIAGGANHYCALFSNDRIKCWGDNTFGQLGYEDTTPRGDNFTNMGDNLEFVDLGDNPEIPGQPAIVEDIMLGNGFSCASIKFNEVGTLRKLKCWGRNDKGQLGLGFTGSPIGSTINSMGNNLSYVDFGDFIDNDFGGNRDYHFDTFSVGDEHSCIVRDDGLVMCWGAGTSGAMGNASTLNSDVPIGISLNFDYAIDVSVGRNFSCAIGELNLIRDIKCWGSNSLGQLGSEYPLNSNVGDNSGEMGTNLRAINYGINEGLPVSLISGYDHTCIKFESNNFKCFGSNISGQLSYGFEHDYVGHDDTKIIGDTIPTIFMGDNITIGEMFTQAKTTCSTSLENGQIKCWGQNDFGQLGQGDTLNRGRGLAPTKGFNEIFIDYIELRGIF